MALHTLAKVNIGCAGWAVPSTSKTDFPSTGSHLERYSKVFSAVEINSSFYRSHRPTTYARWRDSVPADFRFSVKIPRTISHEGRLDNTCALLSQFLTEAGQLREKLQCLLLQMPPSFKFNTAVVEQFFKNLRQQTDVATVCEPRHATWFSVEAADILRQYNIGGVLANPTPVANAIMAGCDRTSYMRLHGSPVMYRSMYEETFLAATAKKIKETNPETDSVWCIFDNTANGAAISNALSLQKHFQSL